MPLISVIVPVYKAEQYLHRCVDSILNQTFSDFELILVDDGSPDGCPAICDNYAEKDCRVVVIHQENGGVSSARNAGLDWAFANSDSEWLSFVDSDDWIHPQLLEALMSAAKHANVPVSIASFKRVTSEIDADTVPFDTGCVELWNVESFFCERNVAATVPWGKLYRKELFLNLRYPIGKTHEDEFLTYQVIFQAKQIAYVSQPMCWYYQNPNGIMSLRTLYSHCLCSEAYEEQTCFFHQKEYLRGRDRAARQMLYQKKKAIGIANEGNHREIEKQLRHDLKRQLRWLRKELNIKLYGNEHLYESAMPFRAAMSRKWRHFKRDIRKLISR